MDINDPVIRNFIENSASNRTEIVQRALIRKGGVLEVWDFSDVLNNKITVTYEVDESIPEGEFHTVIRR